MDDYKIISTSAFSAKLAEPIVIEETNTTRKVLFVDLNDKKKEIGETVGITIVHQRKKGNEEWENVESIPLSSLKGGEGVKLHLDSHSTRKIYDEITKLYALIEKEGVQYGTKEFSIAAADEIVRVTKNRKTIIERLLSENYGEEVWDELANSKPDLATKLSLARIQTNRSNSLTEFKLNLENKNPDESFWQLFFSQNEWIFGYGLNYQFIHLLKEQPDYGGRNFSSKGSQKGDFLMRTIAYSQFTVLVEIKTPATPLLSYTNRSPHKVVSPRNDVWLLSSNLISAVSQIQVNARTWSIDSQKAENIRQLEEQSVYTVEPKGFLVIGTTQEFNKDESIISCFESFRRNLSNPEIITFDELFERAKFIVGNKNNIFNTDEIDNESDDLPF